MTPLFLSTALALAPAAAPPSAAPPSAAPAPAAAVSMAPAPAGPVAAAAPAPVPAPAPAPGVDSTTTVAPAGTSVTVNVYPAPAPAPAVTTVPPVVAPPFTIAAAVIAPTVNKPDPAMVQHSIRRFRRGAVGLIAIGSLGMGVTLALQGGRLAALNTCVRKTRAMGMDEIRYSGQQGCYGLSGSEGVGAVYGALGLATFVSGIGGGASLLGKAAAHRDVQLLNGSVRARPGLKVLGVASIIGASIWMVGTNWTLLSKEGQCGTAACKMRYRPLRYAANDVGALGLAAGSGMLAYAISYEKQGRALMRLRAAPALTRTTAGLSLSGKF